MFKKIAVLLIILSGCAKQGMPPGGPVDKLPPEIIKIIPAQNSKFVKRDIVVQFFFNEWINNRTVEDAVFISPFPGEDVKIKCGAKSIKILFPEILREECTYVVTLGTGIKDVRNNGLEKSFTLAFSTGSVIDKGEISGQVFGIKNAKGIGVWAYSLDSGLNVDLSEIEPDYIVQCEADGKFNFYHIAYSKYRLFAVKDRIADRLYTRGEDEIGVSFRDILLAEDGMHNVDSLFFRIIMEDTLAPALERAVSVNRNALDLLFDKPISWEKKIKPENIIIAAEHDSTECLGIRNIFVDPLEKKKIHILTEKQSPEINYIINVNEVEDEAGNSIDPEFCSVNYKTSVLHDTINPQLRMVEPQQGDKNVYHKDCVHLIFSEAIDSLYFKNGFSVLDTLAGEVSGNLKWKSPLEVDFIPVDYFRSSRVYCIKLSGKWIRDNSGNTFSDTTFFFKTINRDTLSGISGKVIYPDSIRLDDVVVTARYIDSDNIFYIQKTLSSGEYYFRDILPGKYIIDVFIDSDGNNKYSYGFPFPYVPAELFTVYSDTIKTRSRWPNEGNDVALPVFSDMK